MLSWSPLMGAMVVAGSRQSSINMCWRMVPEEERTPVRRKLIIAFVDHVREHHALTGHLAPPAEASSG